MNEKYTCAHCGTEHNLADMAATSIGLVCQDCLDDHFEQCEHCGEWVPTEDYELGEVYVRSGWRRETELWCVSCRESYAFQCDDCGEWCDEELIEFDEDDLRICSYCSDNWVHCCDCGGLIQERDGRWDDNDNVFCDSCWSERESRAIHDYSYKPDPDIRGRRGEDTNVSLTIGAELEVDAKYDDPIEDADETALAVKAAAEGRVYCKHDGSLNHGFEIVSHPGTLAHHMYEMHWADITRICRKAGYRSQDVGTCGLHLHIGRAQLCHADYAVHKAIENNLVVLVSKLREELTRFSRRNEDQLEQWAAMPRIDLSLSGSALYAAVRRYADGSRYHALNFCNDATIEFRFFRGTLKRDTIIASMQLASNMCMYALYHSIDECKAAAFADIIAVNPYKELVAYSTSRGLIPANQAIA